MPRQLLAATGLDSVSLDQKGLAVMYNFHRFSIRDLSYLNMMLVSVCAQIADLLLCPASVFIGPS